MKTLLKILCIAALTVASAASAAEDTSAKRFVATIGPDGYQHVEMMAGSYYFDPSVVVVKVNVPVELTIRKEPGITPHDITMHSPEAGLDFRMSLSSEPKTISFMATKTGSFPFYCDKQFLFFKSHRERGMHGVLEVVD